MRSDLRCFHDRVMDRDTGKEQDTLEKGAESLGHARDYAANTKRMKLCGCLAACVPSMSWSMRQSLSRRFHPQFRDMNRRYIGKSQSELTASRKRPAHEP